MNKQKQVNLILDWLRNKGELTVREAVIDLGIMALPRRIYELRNRGYKIKREFRRADTGAKYGVYTLEED